MRNLGHTRACQRGNHLLLTPDTFVRAPLPGMRNATAIVHAGPAIGAGFTQYTAELEDGGLLVPPSSQRFVYVLEGSISLDQTELAAGHYAYLPPKTGLPIQALSASRLLVIEKPYRALPGVSKPVFFAGRQNDVVSQPLLGDTDVQVRMLLPDSAQYDFAVNLMTFQPGASLPMTESHVMEHGLMMLQGGGIYRLGDCWHLAAAGDFIWMAPFCPQWFGALGKTPACYIIYKDWNR